MSGSISGRKSLDGLSGMIVLSGNVIELGGGSYRANLFDFDTNGDYAGYLFTCSGCVPAQYSLVTQGGISGHVYPASGVSVVASLYSGQQTAVVSGTFVNVWSGQAQIASGPFVVVSSGLNVIGTLYSGQITIPASGFSYAASGFIGREVLTYNFSGLTTFSGQRCLLNANRKLVNKFDLSAASGYLTVYAENDSTLALRQAVTAQSGASPVVSLDTE